MFYNHIKIVFYFTFILVFGSCTTNKNENKPISFYHWKSNAEHSTPINNTLKTCQSKKVYMHFFDVDVINTEEPYPNYVIKTVDKDYNNYEIIPVIYITNRVFQSKNLNIKELVTKTSKLIHQISKKHFSKKIKTIQIDCDWTQTTKNLYFDFLTEMQKEFTVDATIRLHQIKYKDKTGVPPVKHGTLMLYNMGNLKDFNENSILESKIVSQYINDNSNYPINLHLGLPIFSQTILKNNDNEFKIIKNTNRKLYETDNHFKQLSINTYKVVKDTLYKGFYLSNGFELKVEKPSEQDIITSYNLIKNSELNIDEIIFYYLDDESLNNINLETIIEAL